MVLAAALRVSIAECVEEAGTATSVGGKKVCDSAIASGMVDIVWGRLLGQKV